MHEPTTNALPPALPGGVSASGGVHGEINTFDALLEILARRRWLIIALFTFTVGVIVGLTALTPRQYTAHVRFIAGAMGSSDLTRTAARGQTSLPVLNALLNASSAATQDTYAELLRETPAFAHVTERLHLNMAPTELLSHITVKTLNNTSILDVAVTWNDPDMSVDVANEVARSFVQLRRDLVAGQANIAIEELTGQLPGAERKMRETAAQLASYQVRTGITDLQSQTRSTLANLNLIDTKMAQMVVDQRQAQASLHVIESQLAHTPATIPGGGTVAPNPIVGQLQQKLAEVNVQLDTAQRVYTDEHPAVKSLRGQRAQLLREIAQQPATVNASQSTTANPLHQQLMLQQSSLRAQIASDHAQMDVLRRQRDAATPAIRALPAKAQHFRNLQREAKLASDIYDALRTKLNQAAIEKAAALSDVSIIQRANLDEVTVTPNVVLNTVVGLILAAVAGLIGALVVDYFDDSLRDEEDVEKRLALPLLGTVPALSGPKSQLPAPWVETLMVDSILHLVTSLRYASSSEFHTIAFTSAAQGEGKSAVSVSVAIAYAELVPRVLLVDTDLRRPAIHRKLGLQNACGLSDVLVNTATFEDVVRPTKFGDLDVITSGTAVPNAMRLFQSQAFDRFLATAKERYNVVIMDAAGCSGIADAAAVCAKADGTVFVIASKETEARVAQRAMMKLQIAGVRNVLGAVLTNVVPRKSEIGSYGETDGEGRRWFPVPQERSA